METLKLFIAVFTALVLYKFVELKIVFVRDRWKKSIEILWDTFWTKRKIKKVKKKRALLS